MPGRILVVAEGMNEDLVDKTNVFNDMGVILVHKMRKVRKCQKQL